MSKEFFNAKEEITPDILYSIFGKGTKQRCQTYAPILAEEMGKYGIQSAVRAAAFLAQIGHESGRLLYTEEIASGKAYDTGSKARVLGNTPLPDGDGQLYKGRGLIQITGRANYTQLSKALGYDFIAEPQALARPTWAARSAMWWWNSRGLNALADSVDFQKITKIINGGLNGYADRVALWKKAKSVLGV